MQRSFWVETLGCPKNQVDSDKLTFTMLADGLLPADSPEEADLVVVNTCAFIEEAREESVATILALDETRLEDSQLVVTGCMAERYGDELAQALPEVDAVSGFGVPIQLGVKPGRSSLLASAEAVPALDLLNLPRPKSLAPWAYVKVAEGCDKACGFCAIPSFRGPQRSRSADSILEEVEQLQVREIVLIAQDLAAYGRDQGVGEKRILSLLEAVSEQVEWVRLLYLYPSELTDPLIEFMAASPVPYFDLSLQHVSAPLVRRMRRWGSGEKYLRRIEQIRTLQPKSTFRSNFIVGYPGETEADHDQLLDFVAAAQLDWCGFFAYSAEEGTYAADLDRRVPVELMNDRLDELRELQDEISASVRDSLIGEVLTVLVDEPGIARSSAEAPEIDGIINVDELLAVGEFHQVLVTDAQGPDLFADLVQGGSAQSVAEPLPARPRGTRSD
ncbi:MAG: 30S ribosomal protein S12 methylthiotransferase RimO [Actinobacteria bacterium]|nr:30S ribosomal protein S12 methylthiotransferase RimO [Actinomycetota bacterium]